MPEARSARRTSVRLSLKPGAAALLLLSFALLVSVLFAWHASQDSLNEFPRWLKPSLLPGMVPLYVLGTVTKSAPVSIAGFVVGMLVVYGLSGLAVDIAIRAARVWNRRSMRDQ